ncbi:MAG TPA: hypothetical protein VKM36_03920 [Balneolaceae bacterium]|nr:hypothetical protein [Balneolaceae bacterium]
MDLTAVPFTIVTAFFGIKTVKGVVLVRDGNLILKFNATDNGDTRDFYKRDLREKKIPVSDLENIDWERGWLRAVIILTVATDQLTSGIPGSEKRRIKLNIARPYRADAERLIARLRLMNSDLKLSASNRDYQQIE